ncbi:MAG: lipopolysaccharide kinase InaA family protein [Betaproteobacteria bacterium]|nr:lipopolysaccharide kinase InaA family protein [Betaproteobacteria bacterium]
MRDFFADRAVLAASGLDNFAALWNLSLEAVDEPNVDRGGWSSVCRLELPGGIYYLKRQVNHLTRSFYRPLGEPTFAREFRNSMRCKERGVPAVEAVFYGERRGQDKDGAREWRAILLTSALDASEGWQSLEDWMSDWAALAEIARHDILVACGGLARALHGAGLISNCFYPRHVLIRAILDGFAARLIDLEKMRGICFPKRDRIKDMEQFVRHAPVLSEAETRFLLGIYLGTSPEDAKTTRLREKLRTRRQKKDGRL